MVFLKMKFLKKSDKKYECFDFKLDDDMNQMDIATNAFFSYQDLVMVEWSVKMVEE